MAGIRSRLALLLSTVLACRTGEASRAEIASEQGQGTIRVYVEDPEGAAILGGRFLGVAVDSEGQTHYYAGREGGAYTFERLRRGTYWLSIVMPGWRRRLEVVDLAQGDIDVRVVLQPDPAPGWRATVTDLVWYHVDSDLLDEQDEQRIEHAEYAVVTRDGRVQEGSAEQARIDFTVAATPPAFLAVRADNYAPRWLELSDAPSRTLDPLRLAASTRVATRVLLPDDVAFRSVGVEYRPVEAALRIDNLWWEEVEDDSGPLMLDLGSDAFILRAWGWKQSPRGPWASLREPWSTPLVRWDPRDGASEVQLQLEQTVPLVIGPFGSSELVELEVRDGSGWIFRRKLDYGDLPRRFDVVPGDYTVHFPGGELADRVVRVGPEGRRISLLERDG